MPILKREKDFKNLTLCLNKLEKEEQTNPKQEVGKKW